MKHNENIEDECEDKYEIIINTADNFMSHYFQ